MNLVFDDICGKEQFSPRRFNCCLRNRQLEDPHFIRFHLFVQNMRDTRDRDINRLNAIWHYAGIADFARPRLLLLRRVSHMFPPPEAIVPCLREAAFGDMVPLRNFVFDNSLITTFVERWCPEIYTFHLSQGETTITLQDVAYHFGLREHREPVGDASVTSTSGTTRRCGSWWSGYSVLGLQWYHNRGRRERSRFR
ncbi:uncharacterized protein [Arachis hypogaea]|uniref:uncharacterized protein n=1 Tax=Arachis hypogaea TaxID=3818 RepID=UPI0010FC63E4|nr:uncharacterized protein LOC112727685 isoform X2 [Arachis hypogaea]XP_029146600.1 uncharacterized protein LOC112727685 isoform X2 [Arachis hypogaea]XP_029146601.1 uncharacterized protein LOC112727685 isoform X2 [Arachis hypogaea]